MGLGSTLSGISTGFEHAAGLKRESWSDSSSGYLSYPEDILDPNSHRMFLVIAPFEQEIDPGSKGDENTVVQKIELQPIFLPIPVEFSSNYSHNYTTEELLFNVKEIAGGGARAGTGQNIVQSGAQIAAREAVKFVQDKFLSGDLASRSVKSAENAFHGSARASVENIYESPNLRTWEFNIRFMPRNEVEDKAAAEIHAYLKFLSAPTYSLVAQRFPSLFDIYFYSMEDKQTQDYPTSMNRQLSFTDCYLISIDYQVPTMLLNPSGNPIEWVLELQFQEARPLDRNTILSEWKDPSVPSGRVGQVVSDIREANSPPISTDFD